MSKILYLYEVFICMDVKVQLRSYVQGHRVLN